MKVVYSDEAASNDHHSIFLAGPTPRSKNVESWRPEALEFLETIGWNGTVMVPEHRNGSVLASYDGQIEWEQTCLHACGKVVFWVPRDLNTMPAFTTNVEFGYWIARDNRKVMYGRPDSSPKNRYLDWMYHTHTGRTPASSLRDLLTLTVGTFKNGLGTKELE